MDIFDTEERVNSMIKQGRDIVNQAEDYIRSQGKEVIGRVAAFSGGGDSIVSTHFANNHFSDCITFNADTLVGLKPSRDHIEKVIKDYGWTAEIKRAEAEGPPARTKTNDDVVDNWIDGNTAYEEYVLNHGFAGPAMHGRMYQRLKERPLMSLRRQMQAGKRGGRLLVISGIRHDESSIRAGYKRAWQYGGSVVWVNPFYYSTAEDFELYRQEFGLPANPVKAKCGISGECCCGAFGTRDERETYKGIDADFFEYLADLEKRVRERFPWGWGDSPPKWYSQQKRGQKLMWPMLPDEELPTFQPMCVGCNNGRR